VQIGRRGSPLEEGSTTTHPIDTMDDIEIDKWIDQIEANKAD
jgi:hypothetical protein